MIQWWVLVNMTKKSLVSIKYENFLNQINDSQLLKKLS